MKFVIVVALSIGLNTLYANTIGASSSGNWNNTGTWTSSSIPGSGDDVYIGSNTPAGAAATATATLTQNQAASNVYVGDGSGASGTLDLGSNTLTVGNALNLGSGGGAANLIGAGSFTANSLNIYSGNSLTFTGGDAVGSLNLSSAQATTAATGNVTGNVQLASGASTPGPSTLNLGASMSLTGNFDVRNNSTVNMNGNGISANSIFLGWYGGQAVTLNQGGSGGTLTATSLYVGNQTFNLLSMDTVTNFSITNGTSMLMNNVSNLDLSGAAIVTTTSMGTATGSVLVDGLTPTMGASTLKLGAAMSLTGSFEVSDNSTVNLNNHALSANTIYLGWNDGQTVTVNRGGAGGTLASTNLYVGNDTFNLASGDTTANLTLQNAQVTTSATSNVTSGVTVESTTPTTGKSTFTLGANLSGSGNVDVRDGSTLNMNGYAMSVDTVYDGYFGTQSAGIINDGGLTANNLYVGNGSSLALKPNDTLSMLLSIQDGSTVAVDQGTGELTGLTLNGDVADALSILDTSVLDLNFSSESSADWIFRWEDPTVGNWESTLAGLINGGQIAVLAPNGYSLLDQGGYTYIESGTQGTLISAVPLTLVPLAVQLGPTTVAPEPSSIALLGFGMLGLAAIEIRRRRKTY